MKILKRIIVTLVIIIVVLVISKNFIVKAAVENGVKVATGLPLKIDKLDIGFASTHVDINGLSLLNPSGFPKEAMFYSPEIFVDYNLSNIIRGKIHLEEIRLDFDRFVIIKNAQGQTNLDSLKSLGKDSKDEKRESQKKDKKKKAMPIQIDRLALRIGKVVYKDYSKGGDPIINEKNINLSEELTDVTSVQSLVGIIATKAIAKAALNSLVDFNVDVLKDASAVPGQMVDKFKGTADSLKESIKLPFGGN